MNPSETLRKGVASAPGTCGELAQGMLDGVLCLVTCPIDIRSTATVELRPGDGIVRRAAGLSEGRPGSAGYAGASWGNGCGCPSLPGFHSPAWKGNGQQHR